MSERDKLIRFASDMHGATMTVQPGVVDALDALADDLLTARARLADLAVLTDPEARLAAALDVVVRAPSLASTVLPVISGASAHHLASETRTALIGFVDKPTSPRRAHEFGRALADDGHYEAALAVLERVTVLLDFLGVTDEALIPVHREIGFCLGALGHHEEALEVLQSVARAPLDTQEDALPHAFMGHTLLELGRMADARAAFARALDLSGDPSALVDTALFVEGSERLLEFEGQRGGLDARDLHYVQTAGIVLELCGEDIDGVVRNGGYHAARLRLSEDRIAGLLARATAILGRISRVKPTCVVPLDNIATPLSLALASLLGVPHCSARRCEPWSRPLLVAERLSKANCAAWMRFVRQLPEETVTMALAVDWTAETLPDVDIAGLMAPSCLLPWEQTDDGPHRAARSLIEATRALAMPRTRGLERYYRVHQQHRLA